MVKTQRFIFDSSLRYAGSNNNPRFVIPNTGIKADSCYINQISIPHSFYNINNVNNEIHWTDSLAVDIMTSITPGNYTIDEYLALISSGMTSDATDGLTYTASKNSNTAKVTITNSGPTNFAFRYVTSQECPPCFFVLLGFYELYTDEQFFGDYNRIASLTGQSSYTANANYYVSIRTIYIKSNLAKQAVNYFSSAFVNNLDNYYIGSGKNDIIATIPVTTSFNDLIVQENPNKIVNFELNGYGITDLHFELVSDDNYEPIDLNGRSWTIEIIFESN